MNTDNWISNTSVFINFYHTSSALFKIIDFHYSEIRDAFQQIQSEARKGNIEAQLNCYGLSN